MIKLIFHTSKGEEELDRFFSAFSYASEVDLLRNRKDSALAPGKIRYIHIHQHIILLLSLFIIAYITNIIINSLPIDLDNLSKLFYISYTSVTKHKTK